MITDTNITYIIVIHKKDLDLFMPIKMWAPVARCSKPAATARINQFPQRNSALSILIGIVIHPPIKIGSGPLRKKTSFIIRIDFYSHKKTPTFLPRFFVVITCNIMS